MSPKSFIQFHQEGTKISRVQVRCPETEIETEIHTDLVLEVAHLKMSFIKVDTYGKIYRYVLTQKNILVNILLKCGNSLLALKYCSKIWRMIQIYFKTILNHSHCINMDLQYDNRLKKDFLMCNN